MELISDGKRLKRRLTQCFKAYSNSAFAVAWASDVPFLFEKMFSSSNSLQKAVIGTHFYQTDPRVLKKCIGNKNVKFILQTSGVFHPKIFLFWNDDNRWQAFVGSANLTNGAMTKNSEVVVQISNDDDQGDCFKSDVLNAINGYWSKPHAKVMTKKAYELYKVRYKIMRAKRQSLENTYGSRTGNTEPLNSEIANMSWAKFYQEIKRHNERDYLDQRLELLRKIQQEFSMQPNFGEMEDGPRRMIAGLRTSYFSDAGWFGAMNVARYFQSAIIKYNKGLSEAIDSIPSEGIVSESQYFEYIEKFTKALPRGGGVATATRLLAMKRPDNFVCLDTVNVNKLSVIFGVSAPTTMDFERYWNEFICRFRDTSWWNSKKPEKQRELSVWNARVALLDVITYEPK